MAELDIEVPTGVSYSSGKIALRDTDLKQVGMLLPTTRVSEGTRRETCAGFKAELRVVLAHERLSIVGVG